MEITRRCNTVLATTHLTGGVVRVVLLDHERGNWAAYFCPDITLDALRVLEIGTERRAIEEMFYDVKEVGGAEQQQVRNIWSNIGCWHLNTWLHSLIELTSWDRPVEELVDRSDRIWDNPDHRPSHAERRRHDRREMLEKQLLVDLPPTYHKCVERLQQLLALAA